MMLDIGDNHYTIPRRSEEISSHDAEQFARVITHAEASAKRRYIERIAGQLDDPAKREYLTYLIGEMNK